MAQSYKTIHDFQFLNVDESNVNIVRAGTNKILTNLENGDVIILNATAGSIVNLPVPQAGSSFTFIVSANGAHTVAAPTASIYGSIACSIANTASNMLTTGPAKTVIATTAGSTIGDTFIVLSDGTNFYVRGSVANYNALKFT